MQSRDFLASLFAHHQSAELGDRQEQWHCYLCVP